MQQVTHSLIGQKMLLGLGLLPWQKLTCLLLGLKTSTRIQFGRVKDQYKPRIMRIGLNWGASSECRYWVGSGSHDQQTLTVQTFKALSAVRTCLTRNEFFWKP